MFPSYTEQRNSEKSNLTSLPKLQEKKTEYDKTGWLVALHVIKDVIHLNEIILKENENTNDINVKCFQHRHSDNLKKLKYKFKN